MKRPKTLGYCAFVFHAHAMADRILYDTLRACFYVDQPIVVGNTDPEFSKVIEGFGLEFETYRKAKKYIDKELAGLENIILVPEYEKHDFKLTDNFMMPKNVCFWTGADDNSLCPDFKADHTIAIPSDDRPLFAASAAAIVLYERVRQAVFPF